MKKNNNKDVKNATKKMIKFLKIFMNYNRCQQLALIHKLENKKEEMNE